MYRGSGPRVLPIIIVIIVVVSVAAIVTVARNLFFSGGNNTAQTEQQEDADKKAAYINEKTEEYKDAFANPYQAASYGYIDDVIEPRNTRFRVIRAFQALQTKKLTNPLKKHSNIPL